MLVCAGLQKTGSSWWARLAAEVVGRRGGVDLENVRRMWPYGRLITKQEHYFGSLKPARMLAMAPLAVLAGDFVVKTHAPASPMYRRYEAAGLARATLNVRDPRDIALSALDHARLARETGRPDVLDGIGNVDEAVDLVAGFQPLLTSWSDTRKTMLVRYEDLLADPGNQVRRLWELMDFGAIDTAQIDDVVRAVDATAAADWRNTKLNVGVAERFRMEMTAPELERANRVLGPLLENLGYER